MQKAFFLLLYERELRIKKSILDKKTIINEKQVDDTQHLKRSIEEIEIKNEQYPRELVNQEKIREYAENIEKLPPIIVNQNNVLIDGYHRLKAHQLREQTEIKVTIEECDDDKILTRAIELNSKHGLQLSYKDKKRLAIQLFDGGNAKQLINMLSISQDCFNKWVRDIRQKREKQFKQDLINEYLKAELTQQQIADKFGTSIRKVSETKDEFYEKINLLIHNKDKSSSDDRVGFEGILSFSPFKSDVWSFNEKFYDSEQYWSFSNIDLGFDDNTPVDFKIIPHDIFENLIYYYAEQFDIVYFPFARVDSPIDICKKWYRRYYVNNLKGEWSGLEEQREWDFNNGLPNDLPSPKLVFIDMSKTNLVILNELLKSLKKKMSEGYIALLHSKDFDIQIVLDAGFTLKDRIVCNYSKDIYSNTQIAKAEAEKTMLCVYQFLSIFTR